MGLAYDILQIEPFKYMILDKITGEPVNIMDIMIMKSESEPTGASASPGKRSGGTAATDRDRLSPP